jgi:ankyrin repeat protein
VQLLQCRSARDIKDRLGKLPKDLNDSYDGIHQRNTENLGPHDLAHVERAFLWVLGVERQPPSYVILQAVCLSPNGDVDDDEVSKETLLGLCQHLLVIDPNSGNFRYTHASVKEWVEDRYSKFRDAELYIAKLCLTHLLTINEDFEPLFNIRNKEGVDGKKSCKLRYSVQDWIRLHWPQYVQAVNDAGTFDADLVRLLKQFLGSPMKSSSQYRRWASWTSSADINTDADSSDSEGRSTGFKAWERFLNRWSKEIQPSEIALFAIVVYGFTDILMEWWESADMDVTIRNGRGGSLLSMTKSLEVIKLLVKRGIDINMRDWFDWNVLARAIQDKDWEIIRFVIETGRAEVNMDSSVMEVTIFSDLEILKYIIERGGADVNRPFENEYPDSEYVGSALAAVAAFGKLDVVKYLVNEAKADVNLKLQHGRYGNALVAAAHGGHLDIVRFFVNEKKVDVNGPMEHGTSGTALQAASAGCHEQVVQLLLEKNAEVNAPGGEFGNALQAISNVLYSEPKWAIVTMLLDKGADVHTLDGGQGSLLYEASYHDRKELVKMLLNKGVDPNVKVQELYGNALQAASAEGNDVVVEMLLDKGANPNAPGGLFDNALEAASLGGNDVVVKILRERGAEGEYSKRPAWSFEDDE